MASYSGRSPYTNYPLEDEEEMTSGEALVFCVIVSIFLLVPLHYLVALVAWIVGKKIPVNPFKVIPTYAALLTAGFGTIWAVGEFDTK